MPFKRLKGFGPRGITIGDRKAELFGSIGKDGRTTVQIHKNPQSLATWFDRFLTNFADDEEPIPPKRPLPGADGCLGPRLNIAIHIVGSRGDVQPFIPIAQLLSKPPYGHRVRICTHPVFKDFVESNGVEFFSIGGDPEALMAYMVNNPGLLPSKESFKAGEIGKRRREMAEIINGAWRSCIESGNGLGPRTTASDTTLTSDLFLADAIIANPPSMAHIHCAEKLGIPLHMVFTMPWSPTYAFHHPLAAMEYGEGKESVANYMSFVMMEFLTWQGLGDVINTFRTRVLKLDPISPLWGHQLLGRLRVPYTYLWPQSLIPKPQDWGKHINIASFSFLHLGKTYMPPPDLTAFLEKGEPPIYIGFGSIIVEKPEALTALVTEAIKLAGVRAIVSQGWGGIGGGSDPDNIYLIGNCPHDWLFHQVSCVVHHGGAGTTAAGLAAGVPTVVVPFFGDQPFWGQMIARIGAGPVPVPFKDMTAQSLAASITFALKPEVRAAAEVVAQQIAKEDGAAIAADNIHDWLEVGNLKCDVLPDRLAVVMHKKTGAHLSVLAAACLIESGLVELKHCRTMRHKHWYVDEGAESPILGAVAAVSTCFTDIATATIRYRERLKSPPAQKIRRQSVMEMEMAEVQVQIQAEAQAQAQAQAQDRETRSEAADPNGRPPGRLLAPRLTPNQLERFALKLATKSYQSIATMTATDDLSPLDEGSKIRGRGEHGRFYHFARASGRYGTDLGRAGLKAPVALFYNVANGFRNFQSYAFDDMTVRRRGEITGFGSGVKVAGEEFLLGLYDAFSGLVLLPISRSKRSGVKGFGKGVFLAINSLIFHTFAAIMGLPGYTLKGVEKELNKRQLTHLQAELILIRLRQAMEEFKDATDAEKADVVERWKELHQP